MAKKTIAKASEAQLKAQIEKMQAELKRREAQPKFKEVKTGFFTLEIKDAKSGKLIHSFQNLDAETAKFYRKDLYRLMVIKMKQKISMSQVAETELKAV